MFIMKLLLHIPGLSCFWWLLLAMLLPLLLGLLLGYWLWQQYKRRAAELEVERDRYHDKFTNMEKEYAALKYKFDELQKDNNALRSSLHAAEADVAVLRTKLAKLNEEKERGLNLSADPAVSEDIDYAALFTADNLQVIEGIGPKVEATLKEAGIGNWSELASKTPEQLSEILAAVGGVYKMLDPKSWPRQARLASEAKWDELVEYQHFLDTGRETTGDFDTPAKIEQMALKILDKEGEARPRGLGDPDLIDVFSPGNLQIVEGIGPKIEEVLKKAGYKDWKALASASPEELNKVLEDAGPNFRVHDPKSWPQQAKLASEGKWVELVDYQRFLDAGREDKGDFVTPSKAEKMAAKMLGFVTNNPQDLKIIEGIGPKIEQVLKEAGVQTWSDLAQATTDELKEILTNAGDRYRLANPSSWPQQARLAANGNWKALKEYQDFLQGGKDPSK